MDDEFQQWLDEFSLIVSTEPEAWLFFADRLLAEGKLPERERAEMIAMRELKLLELIGPSPADTMH
jgi:hypothetical protein